MEIVGIFMSHGIGGSSGTTTLDIHKLSTAGADQGSIFSTKPSIDSTAADDVFFTRNVFDGIDVNGAITGVTYPRVSTNIIEIGESVRMDIDSAMTGGQRNVQLTMHYIVID